MKSTSLGGSFSELATSPLASLPHPKDCVTDGVFSHLSLGSPLASSLGMLHNAHCSLLLAFVPLLAHNQDWSYHYLDIDRKLYNQCDGCAMNNIVRFSVFVVVVVVVFVTSEGFTPMVANEGLEKARAYIF